MNTKLAIRNVLVTGATGKVGRSLIPKRRNKKSILSTIQMALPCSHILGAIPG